MNKEWSELNKLMQSQIKKRDIYEEGVGTLFALRDALWDTIIAFKEELSMEEMQKTGGIVMIQGLLCLYTKMMEILRDTTFSEEGF
jgi:hypothetical protein